MVRILTIGLLVLASFSSFSQQTARDTIALDKKHPLTDWFTESKYALFLHWGLYSQYSNQWKGKTLYGIGEWIMYLAQADIREYEAAAKLF
ncbi:MAG: alpha-L-fucosidase [Flavipsychrobacter sp.]|jgi:predicted ATP-dependent endonuclease of OLD family|nr:alpha-L-fucosidase [Flavipsychrobacter sp.]